MSGTPASGPSGDVARGVIAVAGEALVDIVPAPVPAYFEFAPGGSPANVAVGLARLGAPARMLARIADDLLGRKLRAHLEDNGVDLSHVIRAREQSSLALVEIADDGVASYDFRISGTADWQWTASELTGALEPDGTTPVVALHSGSLALTTPPGADVLRSLMSRAVDTATISYDPNCRPLLMGDPAEVLSGVHELLGLADVVKVSDEDLHWLMPGHEPVDVITEWLELGPAVVAVTLGGEGVVAGSASGLHTTRPGKKIDVVDTVGAGDSFSAAMLAGLHRRGLLGAAARDDLYRIDAATLDAVLDEAGSAAAITCSRHGANPPTLADLGLQ
ncbi:MAG: carbohydrate kinase [Pseudonocardia sp.]|nr:carbohydrate kinase [Pseudonocardia sp.]